MAFSLLYGMKKKPETLLLNQSLNHDNYTITSVQSNDSVQIVNLHLLNMHLHMEIGFDGEEITNISIHALSNLNPEAKYPNIWKPIF